MRLALNLVSLETAVDDNTSALRTLETLADHNPDDRSVRLSLSETLVKLDRKDEAAAAAKSVLDGTEDPGLLNGAAYVLAQTGLDLPYAEEVSRKGIQDLEKKSAAITTAEVNSHAFAQANLLIASWDTLGWILFREGRLDEAMPLVLAGWRNALVPEGADHLGQIYEAMGKKDEALSTYLLAAAAINGNNLTPDVRRHIEESIARLDRTNRRGRTANAAQGVQDLRTYKVARPEGVSGWGTFRLQIGTTGVIASQQMTGEQKLAKVTEAIDAMKFPDLVPPQSEAHLLRSAVVSCSMGATCDLVLVPNSNLLTEQQ